MRRSAHHSAFTLVELMVSIAIALLLVVGVNTVFKVTSQTVGAGNALLTVNRDARTIFQTFLADANNIDAVPSAGSSSSDGPFFVIRSEHVYAFRNNDDYQVATNKANPGIDTKLFPAAGYPGNQAPVPSINIRSHRVDRLGFFSRGVFARQTSSDGNTFVSTTAGNEAYVYYGHSQQPNNVAYNTLNPGSQTISWYDPGAADPVTNPNNFFAADWMLSRMAIILIPNTTDQNFRSDNKDLSPFNVGATISASVSPDTDLASTSIGIYNGSATVRPSGIQSYSWAFNSGGSRLYPNYGMNWWDPVINYRYQSSPFVLAGTSIPKITAKTLSKCAPNLIRGCSQFIVEYAGNYYTKDSVKADGSAADTTMPDPINIGGVIHAPVPDPSGQLDYYTTINADSSASRHIRWYGFPRSTTGTAGPVNAKSGDVVPARDVFALLTPSGVTPTWDKYADAERFNSLPTSPDYWSGMSATATYTAAWGPDVEFQGFPKMIRIIIEVDDHEGRMNQPQRYEFIYDVQQ